MRIYYFEKPLTDDDLDFVQDTFSLDEKPEQVRIPYLLPLIGDGPIDSMARTQHSEILRGYIRRAGMKQDGTQPILVAPSQMYWHTMLTLAVYEEIGLLPYIVQTEEQRSAIGNPGSIRILDAHGLSGFKD